MKPDGVTWAVLYARTLEVPRHTAAHGRLRFLLSLWRPAWMGLAFNQAREKGLICGLLELTPAGRQHIDHVLAQLTPGGTPS